MTRPAATDFELALFATDLEVVRAAVAGGVESVVVDWEHAGKEVRQADADTEINRHTVDDLRAARTATSARLLCRLNRLGPDTAEEVDLALGAGADELLLPMVRSAEEVERVLELVGGRAGLGILVETRAAVAVADELADWRSRASTSASTTWPSSVGHRRSSRRSPTGSSTSCGRPSRARASGSGA